MVPCYFPLKAIFFCYFSEHSVQSLILTQMPLKFQMQGGEGRMGTRRQEEWKNDREVHKSIFDN